MFRKSPLAAAVSVALAAGTLGVSPQLLAQEVEDAEADDDVIDEIVTTGSRIRRDQFSSNSPIDVVLTETAELKGIGDVAEMLQTTTIAAGSAQVTAATSTAFVQGGGIGAQTLSLRGLGAKALTYIPSAAPLASSMVAARNAPSEASMGKSIPASTSWLCR